MEPQSKDKYSAEKGRPISTWRHGQVSNAGLHRVLMNASVNGTSCLGIYYQTITQRVLPWQSLYPLSLLESPDHSGILPVLFRAPYSCPLSDFLRTYSF